MKEKILNIKFLQPKYNIGQTIYVPQKSHAAKTEILRYSASVRLDDDSLIAIPQSYVIGNYVSLRCGSESHLCGEVTENQFYTDKDKAAKASQFLEVKVDEEIWKRAIGDREEQDPESPYNIENSDLPSCCADVSEMRDILQYCKSEGGLIVHVRNELRTLMREHDYGWKKKDPIAAVMRQLKIRKRN